LASILLVEDEAHIRLLLTGILGKLQHEVTEAQDGVEALQCLQYYPSFDMVITDIHMPRLDGMELLTTLQHDYPTVTVLVISAYRNRLTEALQQGATHQLQKPFSRQEFREAVQATLNRTSFSDSFIHPSL
jgi:two-component system, chemotaxis family, sensor histidine kinase and response regulator PixL